MARFGPPIRVTTDQVRHFESKLFKRLEETMSFTCIHTTANNPSANGLVERFNRQLKAALKYHNTNQKTKLLSITLLGIRNSWRDKLKTTAAKLSYGEPLRLPGEFLAPSEHPNKCEPVDFVTQLREHFQQLRPTPGSIHGERKTFIFKDMKTADKFSYATREEEHLCTCLYGTMT